MYLFVIQQSSIYLYRLIDDNNISNFDLFDTRFFIIIQKKFNNSLKQTKSVI